MYCFYLHKFHLLNHSYFYFALQILQCWRKPGAATATKSYTDVHGGLCRKCHANIATLVELEKRYGEDALVEY